MIRFDLELRRGTFLSHLAFETGAQVSGLFGPTGSGKTTLLLALAGLLTPVRGFFEVGGTVLFDSREGIAVAPEHRRVGMVFQDGRLFPHLTVLQNLCFSRPPRQSTGPTLEEVVELLDLTPLLSRAPHQLSGGERRLVAIGRALLSHPRLLLLDEPLAGLDPGRRRRILAYLLRLKENLQIRMLYVSHVFSDFLSLVDETGLVRGGELHGFGTTHDMMTAALGESPEEPVTTTLAAKVVGSVQGRTRVTCGGAQLELALPETSPGALVYITIGAEDILLTVGPLPRTSARNSLSGRVVEIRPLGNRFLVAVDAGPVLWAEITETSLKDLEIETGSEINLLIKASALRGVVLS